MAIMLGNLSIDKIEDRLNIKFPDELVEIMSTTRQEDVSMQIKEGKWHCFDIPFMLVCGDDNLAGEIVKYLQPLAGKMTGALRISVVARKDRRGRGEMKDKYGEITEGMREKWREKLDTIKEAYEKGLIKLYPTEKSLVLSSWPKVVNGKGLSTRESMWLTKIYNRIE